MLGQTPELVERNSSRAHTETLMINEFDDDQVFTSLKKINANVKAHYGKSGQ